MPCRLACGYLTNYFASLPRELEEAAQVDGCDRMGAMVRIALPLAVPGIVAAALFVFIASWNNFLFAFMFTSGESRSARCRYCCACS